MTDKSKTITISNVTYAMASELGENHGLLERLAASNKINKATWNGNNYYDVEAVKRVVGELRTVPTGYVRAVDHAILLGSDSRTAAVICNMAKAPARKILVGGTKPAWFVEKSWFEKQLAKLTPKRTPREVPAPKTQDQANADAIAKLQKTIDELRDTIKNISNPAPLLALPPPPPSRMTKAQALAEGYRPLNELATELDVSASTLRGWQHRRQVRYQRVEGKAYLHVEDVENMYLKLDENREMLRTRMQGRSNNSLGMRNGHS